MINLAPGILLIADPFLRDPNFMRTVIVLCEHEVENSLGFVINRFYNFKLHELIAEAEGLDLPVYFGGPVQLDTIHFLHQYPALFPGSLSLGNGIYWGGNFALAMQLLKSREISASRIRFYIGYSGWRHEQLENEIEEKSWIVSKPSKKLVFHKRPNEIWKDALLHIGGGYEVMINYPINPQLN